MLVGTVKLLTGVRLVRSHWCIHGKANLAMIVTIRIRQRAEWRSGRQKWLKKFDQDGMVVTKARHPICMYEPHHPPGGRKPKGSERQPFWNIHEL
jgi:hypothetical protein